MSPREGFHCFIFVDRNQEIKKIITPGNEGFPENCGEEGQAWTDRYILKYACLGWVPGPSGEVIGKDVFDPKCKRKNVDGLPVRLRRCRSPKQIIKMELLNVNGDEGKNCEE